MPHPTTSKKIVERPSMSARVSMTRAEVTRIDEKSLAQMKTRLERWAAQLDALETNILELGEDSRDQIRESIKRLRSKYQIARAWFDEFNRTGTARWGLFRFRIESAWNDFEMALEGLRSQVAPEDSPKGDRR
jgi:hypothetical protein